MALDSQIEHQQAILANAVLLHGEVTAANETAQELLDRAESELQAAQEALNDALAALEESPPNEELANQKLAESIDHTAKALDYIKRALAAN